MDDYKSGHIKDNANIKEEVVKSTETLSYKIRGMIVGGIAMFLYTNFYLEQDSSYMIIIGGILGYFFGGIVGSFFYTKK